MAQEVFNLLSCYRADFFQAVGALPDHDLLLLWLYQSMRGNRADLSSSLSILFSSNKDGFSDCLINSSTKRSPLPVETEASRIKQTRSTPSNTSWTAAIMRRFNS